MKYLLLFILATIALTGCKQREAEEQPNIIFILADDLGYGDLGCYGQQLISTPNIDSLAGSGMMFTQFYAGSPVCAPSRSALMTGLHSGHTYIRGNKEIQPEGQEPLADSVLTLAEELKRAGYTTGAFGKWGMGFVGTSGDPLNQGFDHFYGYNCQRQSHRYYPTHLWDNTKRVTLRGNDLKHTVAYAPDLIQEKALAFLDEHQAKPFFLFLPYILPHSELIVPDDSIFRRYKGKFSETAFKGNNYGDSATAEGYTSQRYPRATYAAMVSRLDKYVGEVVRKVNALGLRKKTIIIFASDNGPAVEGGTDPDFFRSAGRYRGYKRDVYEGGIKVPFIASWPGKIEAGIINTHLAAMWDLFPTFLDMAGTKSNKKTDGISFFKSLTGNKAKDQAQHDYLYWEFHEKNGRQAVRAGKWKAVRMDVFLKPNAMPELYDLSADPEEKFNVAAQHKAIAEQMSRLLKEAHRESPIFPFAKRK